MIKFFYTKKQKKFIFTRNLQQKGYSLIEMMVVVVILGLIVLGLVTFFTGGAKSWVAGQSQLEAQRNARQAMDRMVREIREGKKLLSDSDGDTIKIKFPSSFAKNDVTYDWSGTVNNPINRIVNGSSSPLINNVQSFTLTYFDSSGNLTVPESVSKVHIDLKVDVDKDSKPDITLNSDINLRNFVL